LQSHNLNAYQDEKSGVFRFAAFEKQHLIGALFVASESVSKGAMTLSNVDKATKAGTSCGSCRSDISQIIESMTLRQAERIAPA
jgi:NAD(P)H-nitrite reductase large subunit